MNMRKTDIFKRLSDMTEAEQEKLSRRCPPLDKKDIMDIVEMVETKLGESQEMVSGDSADTVDTLEKFSKIKWYRKPVFSVAASLVVMVSLGSALWFGIRKDLPEEQKSPDSSTISNIGAATTSAAEERENTVTVAVGTDDITVVYNTGDAAVVPNDNTKETTAVTEDPTEPATEVPTAGFTQTPTDGPIDMTKTKGIWQWTSGGDAFYIVMDGAGSYSEWERNGELIYQGSVSGEWVMRDDKKEIRFNISDGRCFYFFDDEKRFYLGENQYKSSEYTIYSRDTDISARPIDDSYDNLIQTKGLWESGENDPDVFIYMDGKGNIKFYDENRVETWRGRVGCVDVLGRYYIMHYSGSWYGNFYIYDGTNIRFESVQGKIGEHPNYYLVDSEMDLTDY